MQESVTAKICAVQLRDLFEMSCPIDAAHADEIWRGSAAVLARGRIAPPDLLAGVDTLYAAAEPWDDLADFVAARAHSGCAVLPVFCPDALLSPGSAEFLPALRALADSFGEIADLQGFTAALEHAVERFAANGATRAVHSHLPAAFRRPNPYHANLALQTCLAGGVPDADAAALLAAQIYRILGGAYLRCGLRAEFLTGGARPLQNFEISILKTCNYL
jgi:glucuronate isomerase